MLAGKLNEIIEIHSPIRRTNEFGEVEENVYKRMITTKAQVIYNSGNKIVDNDEIFNEYRIQFIVRIYHKITETDRVKFDGKFYMIESIEKSRQYQLQKLNCRLVNE